MKKRKRINKLLEDMHPIERFLEENNIKKAGITNYLNSSTMMFRYYFNSQLTAEYEEGCLQYLKNLRNKIDKFLQEYES